MMRRQEIVPLVNRTCVPLQVMDDGIPTTLKPGYRKVGEGKDAKLIGAGPRGEVACTYVAKATAARAMDQNKQRGSVNPDDPLDAIYLLGVHGMHDTSPIEVVGDEETEMFDRSTLPNAKDTVKVRLPGGRRSRRDRNIGITGASSVLATDDGAIRAGAEGYVGGGLKPYAAADA
jgi:hypothetical protein